MVQLRKQERKTFEGALDHFTLKTLSDLISKGYFEQGSLIPVSTGKESKVFIGLKNDEKVIVKVYRLETCDFNRMYRYIADDPRFSGLKKKKRKIIFAWAQREYRNLMNAREADVSAPIPYAFKNNVLVMSFIGDEEVAPKLSKQFPKNPKKFFEEVVKNAKKFYKHGFIHADLSAFNILNHRERPVFIDLSHATPVNNPNAEEYLRRDVKNVSNFFKKLGVKIDEEKVYEKITRN